MLCLAHNRFSGPLSAVRLGFHATATATAATTTTTTAAAATAAAAAATTTATIPDNRCSRYGRNRAQCGNGLIHYCPRNLKSAGKSRHDSLAQSGYTVLEYANSKLLEFTPETCPRAVFGSSVNPSIRF